MQILIKHSFQQRFVYLKLLIESKISIHHVEVHETFNKPSLGH